MLRYILLLLIVVGCSDNTTEFKDPKAEYTVVYEYVDSVEARYNELWDLQDEELIEKEILQTTTLQASKIRRKDSKLGFSYNKGDICYIVLSNKPYPLKSLERTIGHEHLHCKYGAWHGSRDQ